MSTLLGSTRVLFAYGTLVILDAVSTGSFTLVCFDLMPRYLLVAYLASSISPSRFHYNLPYSITYNIPESEPVVNGTIVLVHLYQ